MPHMTVMLFEQDEDGGTEVEIEFETEGADESVGIMSDFVSDYWISGNDEETKALQARLNADPKECDRVLQYLNDHYEPDDYVEDYDRTDY
jgi:hypothetical protein